MSEEHVASLESLVKITTLLHNSKDVTYHTLCENDVDMDEVGKLMRQGLVRVRPGGIRRTYHLTVKGFTVWMAATNPEHVDFSMRGSECTVRDNCPEHAMFCVYGEQYTWRACDKHLQSALRDAGDKVVLL
jgi:hypothetical protein